MLIGSEQYKETEKKCLGLQQKIKCILFVFAWFLPSSFAGDGMRMFMLVSWVMSSSECLKDPYIHCLEFPDIELFTMKCNAEL